VKSTFLRVGALVGATAVAVLAAGPALAAIPDSQATAQSLKITIGGNSAISQKITAVNNGSGEVKNSNDTVPQLSDLLPANTAIGLGAAPQDAFAHTNGESSACAGLAGQGGGIAQVGNAPCSMNQGQPVSLSFANLTLGDLLAANNNAALVPLTQALQAVYGPLNTSAVDPLLNALKALPIDVKINLDGVGARCEATPGHATGSGGIAHLTVDLDINGTSVRVINLQADGSVNEKLVGNLAASTTTLTNAVSAALLTVLGVNGSSPISALTGALSGLVGTVQTSLLDPVATALTPLTDALSQNVLEVTFNKQPVPQATGAFDVTSLHLDVLPAAASTIGADLIGGDIGHVTCGPNAGPASQHPTGTPTPTPPGKVPTSIDSGLAGSNTSTIIAAMSVLLAAGGAAGTAAYRRYWMPRG